MKYIQRTSHNITHNFFRELMEDRKIIPPNNEEYYQRFLKPNKMELLDNSSLLNVDKGVQLLKSHLKKDNLILIIVDPDVDGFTSSAVMFLYLQIVNKLLELNLTIDYLLPDGKEHGLATKVNELINNKKYNLVIIPDAASNDHNELKMMKDTGYDTLILDHHEFDRYDENAIVINNQGGDYENRSLSGVGVVYKFLKSVDYELGIDYADRFLDLVATGMCSDMMNLNTLENRYITDQGFKNFRNQGLREIIKAQAYSLFSKRTEEVTDSFLDSIHLTPIQVAFYIAPLINALIRVGTDKDKEILFKALIQGDEPVLSTKRGHKDEIESIAEQNARNCINARSRQNREKDKAIELLDIQIQNNCLDDNKILILNADELNVSNNLTGLVAMGVAAKYKKPVLLGRTTPDGMYLKGSGRGQNGSELQDFRQFLLDSNLMEYVEGHSNAFGQGIKISNIDKLYKYANTELANINFNEGFYEIDFNINANCSYIKELIFDLWEGRYIYGQECPEPNILINNLPVNNYSVCGSNKNTLKITFNDITYIKFKADDLIDKLSKSKNVTLNVIGRASVNTWGWKQEPQILITDEEVVEDNLFGF